MPTRRLCTVAFVGPRSIVILSRTLSAFSWILETSLPWASSRMNVSRIRAALPLTLKTRLPFSSSIQKSSPMAMIFWRIWNLGPSRPRWRSPIIGPFVVPPAPRWSVKHRELILSGGCAAVAMRSGNLIQPFGHDDPRRRLDQGEVREGLREVAEVPAGVDVELLGEEPQRRGDAQQPLHQVAGSLLLADDGQGGHQPERADQERALLAAEAVVGLLRAVAQDEAVLGELVGDRDDARPEAVVISGQETEDGRQERGRVQRVRVVVLAQHATLVDAVLEDVGLDLVGGDLPGGRALPVAADVREPRRPVHGHPAHQLGRDVVLGLAACLPDALVRFPPDRRGALGLRLHDRPQATGQAAAALRVQQDRVE